MIFFSKNKKILVNIFWLCSEYTFKLICGTVVAALVARKLGVKDFGLFQYALSLVVVFTALSYICGSSVLVPRLINADAIERKSLMGNAFILRMTFSIVAYILLVLFAYFTTELNQLYLIAILGASILVSESFGVVTAWLQSQTNNKPRSVLVNISSLVKVCIISILFYYDVKSPLVYATAWLVEPVIIAVGLMIFFYDQHKSLFFSYSKTQLIFLLKQSLPFFGGGVIALLIQRLDIIILRYFSSDYILGIYASAIQLLNSGVIVFAGILSMSMAPLLIYKYDDSDKIKKRTLIVTCIMLLFSLIVAVIGSCLAPTIIPLLFGEQYREAIPLFSWLLWACCLLFIDSGLTLYLIKMNKGKLIFYKWIIVISFAVPIYTVAIKYYQSYGAIFAYAFTYSLAVFLDLFYLKYVK